MFVILMNDLLINSLLICLKHSDKPNCYDKYLEAIRNIKHITDLSQRITVEEFLKPAAGNKAMISSSFRACLKHVMAR